MTELLYVDSSIALAIAFREEGWRALVERAERAVGSGIAPVSSALLSIEMRRVFYRTGRTFRDADDAAAWIDIVSLDHEVVMTAGGLAVHAKTLDAIHLAVALSLRDSSTGLSVWSLDSQMNRAAAQLGLAPAGA